MANEQTPEEKPEFIDLECPACHHTTTTFFELAENDPVPCSRCGTIMVVAPAESDNHPDEEEWTP